MSEKRIFNVGYIEYPKTSLMYEPIKIDISNYPELYGKTDDEIINYIEENAHSMASLDDSYDSLADELREQDLRREKITHVDTEIWVEVSDNE